MTITVTKTKTETAELEMKLPAYFREKYSSMVVVICADGTLLKTNGQFLVRYEKDDKCKFYQDAINEATSGQEATKEEFMEPYNTFLSAVNADIFKNDTTEPEFENGTIDREDNDRWCEAQAEIEEMEHND